MGTSKTQAHKEVVGFHFQEIPLDEAVNAVIAGDGSYSDIKAVLLEKIPQIDAANASLPQSEKKSFAFGLPNGKEVEEDQRRGMCMAVNMTLKKAKILWRVTYSGSKKLFICVPKSVPRNYEKAPPHPEKRHVAKQRWHDFDDSAILALWKKGYNVQKIVDELKEDLHRVRYVCYQKYPRKEMTETTEAKPHNQAPQMQAEEFVAKARDILNYHEPFRNGGKHQDCVKFRAAVSVVGIHSLRYKGGAMDKALGFKNGGSNWYANRPERANEADIQKLRQSLKLRG